MRETGWLIGPRIVASLPGKIWCRKWVHQVEDCPREDHNVVNVAEAYANGRTDADSSKEWDKIPSANSTSFKNWLKMSLENKIFTFHELPKRKFQKEDRNSAKDTHDQIRDEKCTTSIFIAKVGEAPDVSQTNRECNDCQNEFGFSRPCLNFSFEECDKIQKQRFMRLMRGVRGGKLLCFSDVVLL